MYELDEFIKYGFYTRAVLLAGSNSAHRTPTQIYNSILKGYEERLAGLGSEIQITNQPVADRLETVDPTI